MDRIPPNERPFRVGIYPVPGFALMSYACTVEPLRAANLLAGRTLYEVTHFGHDLSVPSSGSAIVVVDRTVGDAPDLDLLLVIAGGDPGRFRDKPALAWLKRLARRGVQMGGVSGGPVILARAGLMRERRMTVHWEHAPSLSEDDPGLLIERRLYVIDRDRVTCGGGTAPLDLMHALIADHHGKDFARQVSDWFLHTGIRASADPQRSGLVERLGTHSGPTLDAVAAMEDHVADPLSLPQLGLIAGVTPRQLNRLFKDKFGQSTMAYYRDVRLQIARGLLTSSTMSVTDVALSTGFSGSSHFSRAFSELYGMSPTAARRQSAPGGPGHAAERTRGAT